MSCPLNGDAVATIPLPLPDLSWRSTSTSTRCCENSQNPNVLRSMSIATISLRLRDLVNQTGGVQRKINKAMNGTNML